MQALAELHAKVGLPGGFEATHPGDTAFYKSIIASGDPEGYAGLCGVTGDLDLRGDLGTIRAPTLLLEGELDRVVRPESVRATADAIPGSEYVELQGCGHIVPLERPAELIERLREFVGRSAGLAAPA